MRLEILLRNLSDSSYFPLIWECFIANTVAYDGDVIYSATGFMKHNEILSYPVDWSFLGLLVTFIASSVFLCCKSGEWISLFCDRFLVVFFNPLRANPIKWWNTLKQFFGKLPINFLGVFDHLVGLAFKKLIDAMLLEFYLRLF